MTGELKTLVKKQEQNGCCATYGKRITNNRVQSLFLTKQAEGGGHP